MHEARQQVENYVTEARDKYQKLYKLAAEQNIKNLSDIPTELNALTILQNLGTSSPNSIDF